MPDEASGEAPTVGPLTFGGEDLSRRLSTNLAACDGSMSLYASAIAHKRRFEYSHSSPTSMLIDAERAKWSTAVHTLSEKTGKAYLKGLCNWLKLDWLGRPQFKGLRLPGIASENAPLGFCRHEKDPVIEGGD